MTSELILHHYDFSNYSEKVRLVLGIKDVAWRSVETPPTLPKPDYVLLTGGYRRAPALQIGADVFCDTLRIVQELEARFPEPTLYPGADRVVQRALVAGLERWTDTTLTRATINFISGAYAHAERFTPELLADRAALLGKPNASLAHRKAAAVKNLAQLRPQLGWIRDLLSDGRAYVLGDRMSLADCVVYHPLWIMDELTGERVGVVPDSIRAWMDRVAAYGHGRSTPMRATEALAVAAHAEPLPVPPSEHLDDDPAVGERVSVTPVDYGRANPTVGQLVAIDAQRVSVQHHNATVGRVNVHFPRLGYSVRALAAESEDTE